MLSSFPLHRHSTTMLRAPPDLSSQVEIILSDSDDDVEMIEEQSQVVHRAHPPAAAAEAVSSTPLLSTPIATSLPPTSTTPSISTNRPALLKRKHDDQEDDSSEETKNQEPPMKRSATTVTPTVAVVAASTSVAPTVRANVATTTVAPPYAQQVEKPSNISALSSSAAAAASIQPQLYATVTHPTSTTATCHPIASFLRLPEIRRLRDTFGNVSSSTSTTSSTAATPPSSSSSKLNEWTHRVLYSHKLLRHHPEYKLIGRLQSSVSARQTSATSSSSASSQHQQHTSLQLIDPEVAGQTPASIDCYVLGDLQSQHRNALIHVTNFIVVCETSNRLGGGMENSHTHPHSHLHSSSHSQMQEAVSMVIVFDMQDATVIQSTSSSLAISTSLLPHTIAAPSPTPPKRATFLIDHLSDTTVVRSSGSSSSSATSSSSASSSTSNHLPTLHTSLSVQLYDSSSQTTLPATLRLESSANELYSFIRTHTLIEFEHVKQENICYKVDASSRIVSVMKAPIHILPPPLLDVRSVLQCSIPTTPIPTVSNTPGSGLTIDVVSFQGIVLEKMFCVENTPNNANAGKYQPGGKRSPSSQLPPTRRWCLLIRDVTLAHTIPVYILSSSFYFLPLLLPGSLVQFRRATRKVTPLLGIVAECEEGASVEMVGSVHLEENRSMNVLAAAVSSTSASDDDTITPHTFSRLLNHYYPCCDLPFAYLSTLSPFASLGLNDCLYRIRARVGALKKLLVKWTCNACGKVVVQGRRKCETALMQMGVGIGVSGVNVKRNGELVLPTTQQQQHLHPSYRRSPCQLSTPTPILSCFLTIDDGSSLAHLFLEGPIVWDFLQLNQRDRKAFEEFTLERGEYEYWRVNIHTAAPSNSSSSYSNRNTFTEIQPLYSSTLSESLRVRQQIWDARLRELYAGMEVIVYAKQVWSTKVAVQAIGRERVRVMNENSAAAASLPSSSTLASTSPTAIPFDSCHTVQVALGPQGMKLPMLQAPPITLRCVEMQPIKQGQAKMHARALLQQLQAGN